MELATPRLRRARGTNPIGDDSAFSLLRRFVEGLPLMRPGRLTLYLGRPDPAAVRAEQPEIARLARSGRRTVVITPSSAPLPAGVERRDPTGWLSYTWFTAVLGEAAALALVAEAPAGQPEAPVLVTDPDAVRQFVRSVEAELARPDPELIAV
jgi:hypothetical protein